MELVAQLLFHKPDDPQRFLVDYLERRLANGRVPLMRQEDVETVFAMFDVTKQGALAQAQVVRALKSMYGPSCRLPQKVLEQPSMSKEEFVAAA